eukprot:scaffold8931_cov65-Phaeocystis_antarctica.AAC.6
MPPSLGCAVPVRHLRPASIQRAGSLGRTPLLAQRSPLSPARAGLPTWRWPHRPARARTEAS